MPDAIVGNRVIGHLVAVEGQPYVTFKDAKRQIRDFARLANIQIGTFRPRAFNRNVLMVPCPNGSCVTAERKVGAKVELIANLANV